MHLCKMTELHYLSDYDSWRQLILYIERDLEPNTRYLWFSGELVILHSDRELKSETRHLCLSVELVT